MKIIFIVLLILVCFVSCYNLTNSSTLKLSIILSNKLIPINETIFTIKSEKYMF
jgi:hypothetical protein